MNKKIRESVSAILTFNDKLFTIKRQSYLTVFPGYHAFPGGKVDKVDGEKAPMETPFLKDYPSALMHALVRELKEELNIDLVDLINENKINYLGEVGLAITPEFNPYRFKNYYFKIELNLELNIVAADDEAEFSCWYEADELAKLYAQGNVLAVPPMISLIEALGKNPKSREVVDLTLPWVPEREVPTFEPVKGLIQLLPLSHTFPPANRTNAFLIGDGLEKRVLVDPSPKDKPEYDRLKRSLKKFGFSQVFITHHHPDHHEMAADLCREFNCPMGMSEWTYKQISKVWGSDYLANIEVNYYREGDVLTQVLNEDVLVYEVPGHDEGQLALAPRSLNWFIVGDLIQTIGTVVIGGEEGDMRKYFASLERVIALNPQVIVPSHGIALGGVHKLELTLKHRRHREEQIRQLYHQGKNVQEILAVIYEGLGLELHFVAQKTIEAHLHKIKNDEAASGA